MQVHLTGGNFYVMCSWLSFLHWIGTVLMHTTYIIIQKNVFLETLSSESTNWGRKSFPECGWHHPISWEPGCNKCKKGKIMYVCVCVCVCMLAYTHMCTHSILTLFVCLIFLDRVLLYSPGRPKIYKVAQAGLEVPVLLPQPPAVLPCLAWIYLSRCMFLPLPWPMAIKLQILQLWSQNQWISREFPGLHSQSKVVLSVLLILQDSWTKHLLISPVLTGHCGTTQLLIL
jgi:hypothetical protein